MNTYALKYRPISFCTIPKGLTWEYVRAPAGGLNGPLANMPTDPRYPHGVFKTDRPLTDQEMYDFEIKTAEVNP